MTPVLCITGQTIYQSASHARMAAEPGQRPKFCRYCDRWHLVDKPTGEAA